MAGKINFSVEWAKRQFDKYKEAFGAGTFTEKTALAPGIIKDYSNARKGKSKGCEGVIADGSEIRVEENTVCVIYSRGKVERMITTPGANPYYIKEPLKMDTVAEILEATYRNKEVFGFLPEEEKRLAYVNLRELRGIKFGTGNIPYHDKFYNLDLEVNAYGLFALQITDPRKFVENFVPAGVFEYTFDSIETIKPLVGEISHSLAVAITSMSESYRISEMTAASSDLMKAISRDAEHVGSWEERFGFKMVNIVLEGIRYTDSSQLLIDEYNEKMIPFRTLEGTNAKTSEMAIRHMIASGIQKHGLGDCGRSVAVADGSSIAMMNNVAPAVAVGSTTADVVTALTTDNSLTKIEQKIVTIERLAKLRNEKMISEKEYNKLLGEVVGL